MADNNPLAYMGAGMKIGQSIGGSSGAESRKFARALALKQVGMQTEIKKHGIKNGFGIKRKEGKLVFDENLYSSANERSVGLQSFLKTENEEASKVFAQNTKDLVAIEKALTMAQKSKNPELKSFYGSIMQRHLNHLGMKVDANDVLSGIRDWKDETTNALVKAEKEFRDNPTSPSAREKYKALYVKYPNIAEELKLYDPNTPTAKAEKDGMTVAQFKVEEKKKEIAKAERTKKYAIDTAVEKQEALNKIVKPDTMKDVNATLLGLAKAKARLKAGKGYAQGTLQILAAMNPKALGTLQGDVSEAIAEIDKQVKYYNGVRDKLMGKKPKPVKKKSKVQSTKRLPGESVDAFLKRTSEKTK